MKRKSLISLVCVAVLSQYGLAPMTALATENDNTVTGTASSEDLKPNTILDELPLASTQSTEEATAESEDETVESSEATTESTTEESTKVEEAKTLNWEFKDPQQALIAGDDLTVKIKGTQEAAKIVLPEGIEYDAEKNVEELRPLISFDKEKRELTLTKINEYEEIELVLTVEKAGDYELQMTNEALEDMGDKLKFTVAEKAEEPKEDKKETEEKEATKESSTKEETKKSTESTESKSKAKKSPRAMEDARVNLSISSDPDTEVVGSKRILYTTTFSHGDATSKIDGGKLVVTLTNGYFQEAPKASDYPKVKTVTISSDKKQIILEMVDGFESGNMESFSFVVYTTPGLAVGDDVTMKAQYTGTFTGESSSFESNKEKKVTLDSGGISPITPNSPSWTTSGLDREAEVFPGVYTDIIASFRSQPNATEGFRNLRVKLTFSDKDKISWTRLLTEYGLTSATGATTNYSLKTDQIEKIDDTTYILNFGPCSPREISVLRLGTGITPSDSASPGDQLRVDVSLMDENVEIYNKYIIYKIKPHATDLVFRTARDEYDNELAAGQDFLATFRLTGQTSKEVTDTAVTVKIPNDIIVTQIDPGLYDSRNSVEKVEYYANGQWNEVTLTGDRYPLPTGIAIEQIRVHYLDFNETRKEYQPIRVRYKVKDTAKVGDTFTLEHSLTYKDFNGDVQTPDVSSKDLTYEVIAEKIDKESKAVVAELVKGNNFDSATVVNGDQFNMNYRFGAKGGKIEKPYIFVKVPKGLEVTNNSNTIQRPYIGDITYPRAPSYGHTSQPISRASSVGSFTANDGDIIYYYKADDTALEMADYLEMLFIENTYTVNNMKSGQYTVEVGMGSLNQVAKDVELNNGYTTQSLSGELSSKLGATATTYYSKKTKLNVGKVDRISTNVSVKGSEDSAWLTGKVGSVVPGKKVSYRISVKNEGTENYSNLNLVNILPYIGDNLVGSNIPRGSQFQINPDSDGVKISYNGTRANGIGLEYSTSKTPERFSSTTGATIAGDGWTSSATDLSTVRALRVTAPGITIEPGDEIVLEYSGVIVLDAKRPSNDTESFIAHNSVAYRFETVDGQVRAGEPAVTSVKTVKAESDGLLSGRAYIDLNKNGVRESGEPYLNQVKFELFKKKDGAYVSTGITNESSPDSGGNHGVFGFTGLDYGDYQIKVYLPTAKNARFTSGVKNPGKADTWVAKGGTVDFTLTDAVSGGQTIDDFEVGIYQPTPLAGSVLFKDKNGVVIPGDYGKDFKVQLFDKDGGVVGTTTSGVGGLFNFEDLDIDAADKYTIKITQPSGKDYEYLTTDGELKIDMEPGSGTKDATDLFITDKKDPTGTIELSGGHGTGKDINPTDAVINAADNTTPVSIDWEILNASSTVEYSGTSTNLATSLAEQIDFLKKDKKAGVYTIKAVITDAAGNEVIIRKNFTIKFGNVKYMVDSTEYATESDLLLYVDKLTKPATDPTKAGYVFDKWVTKPGGTEWNFSTGAISEENLVLEATFKAAKQAIRFDVNGGDASSKPDDIEGMTAATIDLSGVKAPTRTGYTFKHWYQQGDAAKANVGASVTMPVGGMTLVAEWEANSYKVSFDKNDGTGTMGDQSFKYDTAQNLTANTFTRDGFSFEGWSTTKGGAKKYSNSESVKNLTTTKDGTVTLFAVWAATEQTITFDVNGGLESSKPAPIKGDTDATIDLKDVKAPTRTGYTFKHWYKQGDASKANVGNSVKMPAKGMTLVAEWEANSYTVAFDKNEGTGTMAAQNFKYDTAQNLTANSFTRSGYSFQGWSTTKTGSVEHTDGKSVTNLTADKDGSVTLYAIWKADSQVLQFDVNGGDISSKPGNINGDTDSTVDLKDVKAPTRTGYTFKHWYKQGDADKKDVGNSVKMPATGMTLVAEWEANSYSVKFHSNTGTGTMANQSFKYGESKKLTKNSFTKDGYTFVGWATATNAASSYTDEYSVSNLTYIDGETVDLYAVWSASAQVIQFDVNGGDVTSKPGNLTGNTDDMIDLKDVKAPTRTGYSFKHWYKQGDADKKDVGASVKMPAKGMTLVAEWEANTYKVKFNANGGTETMNDQSFVYDKEQALSENKFTRAGYTFAGWATTAAGASSYADKAIVSKLTATDKEVVELFAVWSADNQTIQFDVNGGVDSSKPADIVAGTDSNVDLSKVKAPTRKGYTFNHWYKKDDAAKTAVTGTITMPVGGMILVADWKANDYKVMFDANEGTGTMADQDFVYDTEQKLTANAFDRTNYDFVGWSTTKTGEVEFTDEESVKNLTDEKDGSQTLYAIWKIQERVISFDVNGGDVATQPADIQTDIGENVELDKVAVPTREGYTFSHWYDKEDATKTAVSGTIPMPDKNMVLVAAWNANHYKVKFNANGGTGSMKDQAFVYDSAQDLTANVFERKNYDFVGWSTDKEGTVAYYDQDSVNNLTSKDGDTVTLYAVWEKKAALPVIKANNIVMTTKQVDDYTKANTLERKIAELADAKVVDENTSDVIATHEKIAIDHSKVVNKEGVYKATVSYTTKARSLVDPKEIDVTVIEPTTTQKITFDVNGGDEKSKPADISAKVGTTVSLKDVKAPTRSGYSFTGWFNGETKVGDTVEMPENGMTLVAHWSQNGGGNGSNGNGTAGGGAGSGTTNTNVLARTGTTSTGKSLPQTNDTPTIGMSIVGGMLALLALFGFKKKKDEESETESK